ncbi:MAG TPA: ribosome small subunit-dependent GTPase A [Nocardioidaceae bacterium]|nr:ribosome small subunit-dependent GTPase A [Nocardioidaceae bacterium]
MLETIGYEPQMARWAVATDAEVGRVVCVHRGVAEVLTERGMLRAGYAGDLLCEVARDPVAAPSTGDWVVVRDWPDHRRTVESVLPRTSAVVRATAGKQSHGQVLCANADVVAVVVALHPDPPMGRIERLLALAWQSGATPIVVLTKTDLVKDAEFVAEDVRDAAPGAEVLCTSTVTGAGVSRLHELVAGRRTLALIGASGHGKSSLVNALVGVEVLGTREIRQDGRGRHTSVRRELVPLPGGGVVIDTPGLRGVGLLDTGAGLASAFADVEGLVAQCRFRDCSHRSEPGCAVRAALDTGELGQRRYDSWLELKGESEVTASRIQARTGAHHARSRRRDDGTGAR